MASDDLGLAQSPAQAAEGDKTRWMDRKDDLSNAIEASHPLNTGRHDLYQRAMELVGNRHSKGGLVCLVNHLLSEADSLRATLSAEGSATIAAADPPTPQRRQADMATDYNDWKSLLDGRFWLEMREPGKVPQRKGSWPLSMLKETLREFMKANPAAMISVVTISHDGPCFDDAPEALAVLDGRTWPTGKKHIASSNAAHAAFASEDRRVEEMRERAAEDERDRLLAIANRQRYTPVSVWLVRNGAVPPSDRAIFRSRAQKATATPTIADPDGEARS